MGAILSKFWPNKSNNGNNSEPQLAIAGPPPRLPILPPPPRPPTSSPPPTAGPVNINSGTGEDKSPSTNHGRKSSKKQQQQQHQQYQQSLQQQSGQQLEKPLGKNVLPLSNQSFIYKTVLEATVSDAKANEEEERVNAAEAPGPFEIETDLLSPEIEEAVIKIQANVRGYLTRKQYRGVTPDRSVETSQQPSSVCQNQEPIESSSVPTSSSGILAPPPSFSDTPKEFPLDHDDNQTAASQRKRITEKLIELEKQVSQQSINKPLKSTSIVVNTVADDVIVSRKEHKRENFDRNIENENYKQSPVDCVGEELKPQCESNHHVIDDETISSQRQLEIPSIETSEFTGPEEAAIKIQAAFRGYQVRKTISRETSPCKTRGDGEEDVVQLREKDFNSAQDSERESILVLDQLEECLSQELMRSSMNLDEETPYSSYTADLDLNTLSLQSSALLMASAPTATSINDDETSDLKTVTIDSGDLSASSITNSQLEKVTIGGEKSITATIPDEIKPETVNNIQIVELSSSDSPLISTVNQVPKDVPITDFPDNQIDRCDSSSSNMEDKSETIKTEPVLFVPSDEKVNAIDETVLISESVKNEKHEIDPVVFVELNGKLDASNISESNDQPIKEIASNKTESPKESVASTTDAILNATQLVDNEKFRVDCESTSVINESSKPTTLKQPSVDFDEPEIEPLFSDMSSPLAKSTDSKNQQIITNEPVNSPQEPEQITSSIPDVHSSSSLSETVKSDEKSDINIGESTPISLIATPVQEPEQKVIKLIKEDSFGSDILILDDDKSDTLYDPFADNLTGISSSVKESTTDDEQLTTSFVDENLIKSVVNDINNEEGLLLYESSSESKVDNQKIKNVDNSNMNENITEIQDDILVNLDESDEEDEDSQKRPVEIPVNSDSQPTATSVDQHEVDQSILKKELSESVILSEEKSPEQPVDLTQSTNSVADVKSIHEISEVSKVTSIDVEKGDLESEKQLKVEQAFTPIDESVQQSIINHDTSSIQGDIDDVKNSANPFLNQPDFDSDLESGKIIPSDQESSNLIVEPDPSIVTSKIEQSSQQLGSTSTEVEINTINAKDVKPLESIVPIESKDQNNQKEVIIESPIVNENSTVETTDSQTTFTKDNDTKDNETSTKQVNEDKLSSDTRDDSKETLIVTESTNQPNVDIQLTQCETSTFSLKVDQPEIKVGTSDDSVNDEPKIPTINESSANDETEARPERDEASPENANLLLRLQDRNRETRSRSPNPFGRKKRRQKKNRGGAN